MIIKFNQDLIQITRIADSFAGLRKIDESMQILELTQNEDDYEKTLEQLPTKQSFILEKELEYMFLTGQNKNKKETIDGKNPIIFVKEEKIRL